MVAPAEAGASVTALAARSTGGEASCAVSIGTDALEMARRRVADCWMLRSGWDVLMATAFAFLQRWTIRFS